MRKAIVILALVGALLAGLTVGLALNVQPVPDKFIFWGASSVGDSALKVTEYELEREGIEIVAVVITVFNGSDVEATNIHLEVDITSYSVRYPSATVRLEENIAAQTSQSNIRVALLDEPSLFPLLLGITKVEFFITHD